MPQTTWKEINDIMHNVKRVLTKIVSIEAMCKEIKKEAVKELEVIDKVILQCLDEEEKCQKE